MQNLPQKKQLEIANICYANVAGSFALFTNTTYQGPNFTWLWWRDHLINQAEDWLMVNDVKGNQKQNKELAIKYTKEITNSLLYNSGILEK
jgi:hypothetical protein